MFGLFTKPAREDFSTLPVADIQGATEGPTLLVTAGLDGDEYAGIGAAYAAAETYRDGNFSGRLVILPVVNVAGFDACCSINPADKKFPKYCIPGSAHGTASEQLMHHIIKTYASTSAMWLDLHSGASDEIAIPCLWNDITGNAEVDTRGEAFTNRSGVIAAVREPAGRASHALAKLGCSYVLAESEDETRHKSYIKAAMSVLGMIYADMPASSLPRIFKKTRDMYTPRDVQEGEMVLWQKIEGKTNPGGRIGEIAYDEQSG
jgi:predicted deacylase